jgi:hypothetical protein
MGDQLGRTTSRWTKNDLRDHPHRARRTAAPPVSRPDGPWEANRDRRFAVAARNIRLVADTLDQVDGGVWVDVAMLDVARKDVLLSLIAARLLVIAFD